MSTGLGTTSTLAGTTDYVANSFAAAIARRMPNGQAPLFAISSRIPTETAVQTEHGYFAKTMIFPSVQLNGAIANGAATTFTVDSTTDITPGMLLQAQTTREIVIVNTVVSSTQITVTRGVGTTAAAAIADDVVLHQIGNAFEEASDRPTAMAINPVRITNLTQIFRNSWALSRSAQATQVIAGESPVAENRMDCAAFHAVDIEKAMIFGQKSSGTRNGQPFRTMDGLINITSTLAYYPPSYSAVNVFTAGATTNYTQLESFFDPTLNQVTDPTSSNERVLFVGSEARKVINNIGRLNGTYMMQNGQTSFGLKFASFNTGRGTFNMIEHPLLNANSFWAKMAICVDLSAFRLAYLGGRNTIREEYNQDGKPVDAGIDAVGGTITSELTVIHKNPPANGVVFNLTAAAQG